MNWRSLDRSPPTVVPMGTVCRRIDRSTTREPARRQGRTTAWVRAMYFSRQRPFHTREAARGLDPRARSSTWVYVTDARSARLRPSRRTARTGRVRSSRCGRSSMVSARSWETVHDSVGSTRKRLRVRPRLAAHPLPLELLCRTRTVDRQVIFVTGAWSRRWQRARCRSIGRCRGHGNPVHSAEVRLTSTSIRTMSPYQHARSTSRRRDLDRIDLGHNERFTNTVTRAPQWTQARSISRDSKERRATILTHVQYSGNHNEIKECCARDGDVDFVFWEIGARRRHRSQRSSAIRQFRQDIGRENTLYIHMTLVPSSHRGRTGRQADAAQRGRLRFGSASSGLLCRRDGSFRCPGHQTEVPCDLKRMSADPIDRSRARMCCVGLVFSRRRAVERHQRQVIVSVFSRPIACRKWGSPQDAWLSMSRPCRDLHQHEVTSPAGRAQAFLDLVGECAGYLHRAVQDSRPGVLSGYREIDLAVVSSCGRVVTVLVNRS